MTATPPVATSAAGVDGRAAGQLPAADPAWHRRVHPRGGCRDFFNSQSGVVWMALVPRANGTYAIEVGRDPRRRVAQRRSGRALRRLQQRVRLLDGTT